MVYNNKTLMNSSNIKMLTGRASAVGLEEYLIVFEF